MPSADVVCGLGFGDEGKGITTARLVRAAIRDAGTDSTAVVRYSGGPQNAHTVCRRNAGVGAGGAQIRRHTFAQIGSGSGFDTDTFTAEFVPVNPISLFFEAEVFTEHSVDGGGIEELCARQYFHEDSPLILPLHEQISKSRERRLGHGSTGRGIFEAGKFAELYPESAPRMKDLLDPATLTEKLRLFVQWANAGMPDGRGEAIIPQGMFADADADQAAGDFSAFCENSMPGPYRRFPENILPDGDWHRKVQSKERLIFEGGQGVLLDRRFGFFPNVTFACTTPVNAARILGKQGVRREVKMHGVTRTYATRHGAGLLPLEIFEGERFQGFASAEKHNAASFAGRMRFAPLSRELLNYAVRLCELDGCGLSDIHVTHCDIAPFRTAAPEHPLPSGRETADLAFALLSDGDAGHDAICSWGRTLASSETRMMDGLPPFFKNCKVHFHDNPFVEEVI